VENFARTVKQGRLPGLTLRRGDADIELTAWGVELLDKIAVAAELLDRQRGDTSHATALAAQRAKLHDAGLTPSAKVLRAIRDNGGSFEAFALEQSRTHATQFRAQPPSAEEAAYFTNLARESIEEQARMEREQTGDFDEFITDYRSRTPQQLCD